MPVLDGKEASSPNAGFPLQRTYQCLVIKLEEMISKNYMQGLLAGLSAQT